GYDSYWDDATGSVVMVPRANEGTDTVRSSITYTLGSSVENLVLTGTAAIDGTGNEMDNLLQGNSANNTLAGGGAADTYLIGRGSGIDTIQENDSTAGISDQVQFGTGIAQADTTYARSGNDLIVSLAGSGDALVIQDWYLGTPYQIEQFRYADGSAIA